MLSMEAFKKRIKSVDFFHTRGDLGQIHTFLKVWEKGVFFGAFCSFWPFLLQNYRKFSTLKGRGVEVRDVWKQAKMA